MEGVLPSNLTSTVAELARVVTLLEARLSQIPLALPLASPGITVAEVARECRQAKERAGCRARYLRQLKSTFKLFTAGRADVPIADITAKEIEAWLYANQWSARTRANYLVDVRTLFSFALRRGYVRENAALRVEKPQPEPEPCGVLSLADVWQVLEYARALGIGHYVGVMLFAGLRPEEADKLRPENFKGEYIEVQGHKGKTRRRRLVPILPALRTWLDLCGPGAWPPVNRHRLLARVHRLVKPWPHDALRNCFVSYALPEFGPAKVALWAGHSEGVMFSSYAELVSPQDAAALWGLCCPMPSPRL